MRAGLAARAWGVDRRAAPLAAAAAKLDDPRVTLVLGDGLAPLATVRPDAVVLAGLGARTIVRVLAAGPLDGVRQLVLQPNTEAWRVRRWAYAAGWRLTREALAEGFPTLRFEPGDGPDPAYELAGWSRAELELLGPWLVRDPGAASFFADQATRREKLGDPSAALWARAARSAKISPEERR